MIEKNPLKLHHLMGHETEERKEPVETPPPDGARD
jgi:hypothetical protein